MPSTRGSEPGEAPEQFVAPLGQAGLFGVLTRPREATDTALLVLNAGLLPSPGPYRLHIDLAAAAAHADIACLRLDQSGKGESPARQGLARVDAVREDVGDACTYLASEGIDRVVLVGLCSGADDAMFALDAHAHIVGAVLLDGMARRNWRFRLRQLAPKLLRAASWRTLLRRAVASAASSDTETPAPIDIREWVDPVAMCRTTKTFLDRGGGVLAVFTGSTSGYYNHQGQLRTNLQPAADARLTEAYWPDAEHLYPCVRQRRRLLETIGNWLAREVKASVSR